MNRRSVLRSLAIGTLSSISGCVFGGPFRDNGVTVSVIETGYPRFFHAYYDLTASTVPNPEGTPVSFEELPSESRVELANAIHRDRYVTGGRAPDLLQSDFHRETISYRGSIFDVRIGVADRFTPPEHGPIGDPDWKDPVEVSANVEDRQLTLTITNELDTDLPVHHFGRPYFGVLIAVHETAVILDHERYKENDHIRTGEIVSTEVDRREELQTEVLSPDESLRESYTMPGDLTTDSTIWLMMPLGDDSIELFGNRPIPMTTTVAVEL